MEESKKQLMPHARKEGLVVRELSDEVLVYDLDRHKAHCLNRVAALVWKHCEGRTTIEEMARTLTDELGMPVDSEIVLLAIVQLDRASLLSERTKQPARKSVLSRRELARRLGLAAAVSLPLITSIVAPTVFAAASCTPNDPCGGAFTSCTSNEQCCSCSCVGNTCQ